MSLEAPPSNYYDFFGFEHTLNLDLKLLESRFYSLSRQWHPDRFALVSEGERQVAVDASAILNDGYRTLKDPVRRAEYLLSEQGFDIGEQKSNHVPPELLEEVFELNMALDESDREQLTVERTKFDQMRDSLDGDLSAQFLDYDSSRDRAVLETIRAILNKRKYIVNLIKRVDQALAEQSL